MDDSTKRYIVFGISIAALAGLGTFAYKKYIESHCNEGKGDASKKTLPTPAPEVPKSK